MNDLQKDIINLKNIFETTLEACNLQLQAKVLELQNIKVFVNEQIELAKKFEEEKKNGRIINKENGKN